MPFDFIRGGGKETYTPGKVLTISHGDPNDPTHIADQTLYISTTRGLAQRESVSPAGTPDTPVEPEVRQTLTLDPETLIVVYPLPMSGSTAEVSPYDVSA